MEGIVVTFPLVAGLIGILLGWVLTRWVSGRLAWILCTLLMLVSVVLVIMGQGGQGFDGLGYVIVAVLMVAPAGLGTAPGTVIAAAQRRRQILKTRNRGA